MRENNKVTVTLTETKGKGKEGIHAHRLLLTNVCHFRHCSVVGFYTSSKLIRRAIALEMVARVIKCELRSRWRDIVVLSPPKSKVLL